MTSTRVSIRVGIKVDEAFREKGETNMVETAPCPLCRHTNPPGNRFCGSCGAPLTSGEQIATR
jgi:hypothetical protein